MKKEFRVFEGKTLQEAMDKLLNAGFKPLSLKETFEYRKRTKQKDDWFDTGSCYDGKGNIRKATLKELRDLKRFYAMGGRLLFLSIDYFGLIGYFDLYYDGRFVGVKNKKKLSTL